MITIRDPQDGDTESIARLAQPIFIMESNEQMIVDRRRRYANRVRIERVAEKFGAIVGWLEYMETGPQRGFVRVSVESDCRGQGIGSALLNDVEVTPEFHRATKVYAEVRDNDDASLSFALGRGFSQGRHVFESTLPLEDFSVESYRPLIARLESEGIRFTTVAELGDTEENRYRLWHAEYVTDLDIPGSDPNTLVSWEEAQSILFSASWYTSAGEFVALDGDEWVGICGVAEVHPGEYYNQHTGTMREYRGRGIATALKALALDYVKQAGGRILRTHNHSDNAAMLAINTQIGYRPEPGWYELQRTQ